MRVRGSGRELFTRASFLIGLLIGQGHKQGDYSGFQLRVQERGAFGVRRVLIPLANSENGTVQGAVATWWTRKSLPTKHQVATAPCTVPIRQRYQDSPHSKRSASTRCIPIPKRL